MKVCVVTGSRAEYGLLYWVMRDLLEDPEIQLQVLATGMHLEPRFGMTVDVIEADGFTVDSRVPIGLSGDTPSTIAKAVSAGVAGVSDAIESLAPDLLLVLGDRFEILAAVQAAMVHGVPVAHIAGGDVTEGAFDEAIRHAITKMSHLHLVTNPQSGARVRQMGENPESIHVVGSPGLDHLRRTKLLDRDDLAGALGAPLGQKNLLVTFHPVTLERDGGRAELSALLDALSRVADDVAIWITRPNADPGNIVINALLDEWAHGRSNVHVHTSLGQVRYLSLMKHADAVVGNSSSGLYEAPSFDVVTVNVGERQAGRLAATSVMHVDADADAIHAAIEHALVTKLHDTVNPYGDGRSAARIVAVIKQVPDRQALLKKRFHEVDCV